jgi:hypothetical protein
MSRSTQTGASTVGLGPLGPIQKFSTYIFFTSRPQVKASIEESFQDSSYDITVEANEDDIRRYVLRQLQMDENYGDMDEAFKNEIIDKIVETADGM